MRNKIFYYFERLCHAEYLTKSKTSKGAGFTLIEVLIAMALFIVISYSVYQAYANILEIISRNQWRTDAAMAIENEIETVRGMDFEDVGVSGGFPAGALLAEKNLNYGGLVFDIKTTVRNIDDPFDGTLGGNPNDTAPADYKLVEFEAICRNCYGSLAPVTMTTTVAPRGLETAVNTGALFINVFNAFGQPVSGANVHVVNSSVSPAISIDDTTNNDGVLQLVSVPTSTTAYEISVSKSGYSSEQTYPPGAPANPNPVKPHATVTNQTVTSISFAVDQQSNINFRTRDRFCGPAANVNYSQTGTKLIGSSPDVLKFSASGATDAQGIKNISGLEWDSYNFTNTDGIFDLAGSNPPLPVALAPGTTTNLFWLMEQKAPSGLLVLAKSQSGVLLDGAVINLSKAGFDKTLIAGRSQIFADDWSGNNYSAQSGEIETEAFPGEIRLAQTGGKYATSSEAWLVSNTVDLGAADTGFYSISWNPQSQPPQTSLRFQLAANNDNATWNFSGPDGTGNSYYETSGSAVFSTLNANRYLRYKVFLRTTDENASPSLNDLSVDFSSSCLAPGQAFFGGLASGTYSVNISKDGFQNFFDGAVSVLSDWQSYQAALAPN